MILLVEDDPVLGPSLKQRLELEGFAATHATTLAEARAFLGKRAPSFVLSDIRLPDGSGADLQAEIVAQHGSVPTIFMTAYGSLDQAVDLVKGGARDYLAKPFDLDDLVARIKDLAAPSEGGPSEGPFATFGLSPAMEVLRATLDRLAEVDLPVLLIGETGTGKEVAARYLHAAGSRASRPFEALNCGQVSSELADSMLFGHERGAFTGAHDRRAGILETVANGTLLLDEIGETRHDLQLKLLRVLQERTFRRLGATSDLDFHGRIVCATNRDLEEAVRDGAFREDLLFRLNVVTLRLPPLRERREEIEPLLKRFAHAAAARMGTPSAEVAETALSAARGHDWPGNIRELRNRVERAVALASGPVLGPEDLFPEWASQSGAGNGSRQTGATRSQVPGDAFPSLAEARDEAERAHIERALAATDGRLQDAAELLGVSRTTLWEKIRRYRQEGHALT
jgi:DNA-binding NtrC family response regulator